ncbi:Na+/H+ antiporter NhaC family protein [Anaerovorax odorimutans]|uniref:Na+/H+ antiporter NhaC family protein n=1 Tax=Anaerovorax odorimutans TaxID=109327 RepID=UPI0003FCEFB8|nr:Na+/H+ antiporter NhaC family protein [Anaerovorax odorimutans]
MSNSELLVENRKQSKKKIGNMIFAIIMCLIIGSFIIKSPSPDNLGWYTLVPSVFAITYIFWAKDVIMAYMLAGLLATYFMAQSISFIPEYFNRMFDTAMGEAYIWLVIVCGMMGSIIVLIEKSGGAKAFSIWIAKYIKSRKAALLCTFGFGGIIFTDDYLNSLAVGPSMAVITDEKKVSREMLSYIVDTMAAAPCVLIPISTWGAFIASVLEVNNIAEKGEGMKYFIKTIPFSFYAMATIVVCFLVIIGVIPLVGKMKKAEYRAYNENILAPPGSEKIAMTSESDMQTFENPRVHNIFIPLVVLVITTLLFDMDMFMGCIVTLIFCFFFFIGQRLLNPSEFIECIVQGFTNMSFLFVLVCFSYTFTATLTELGFATYVVENAQGFMSPQLMPFILFLIFGATEFMTGTNWDLYMLMLPVVVPLTQAIGCDPILSVSAVISAGVWGSHVCVASDATVCTSSACGCENYEHATSQMPYAFIAYALAAIAYLVAGFIIG